MKKRELARFTSQKLAGINRGVSAWADTTTKSNSRDRAQLIKAKRTALLGDGIRHNQLGDAIGECAQGFFTFTGKAVNEITPMDVKAWQHYLEDSDGLNLRASTVYSRLCRLSSFYDWARSLPNMSEILEINPVDGMRPPSPTPYQSESAKSLTDQELSQLIAAVKARADAGEIVGKRDFAILIHFVLTSRRRAEVLGLRWKDVKNGEAFTYLVKGGVYQTWEVKAPLVKATMIDYLESSGRLDAMTEDAPIWTRHDKAGEPGKPLTSHAYAKNIKRYAAEVGIENFHIHQLRHTFARLAGDESKSIAVVQEALGHASAATTKIYLDRVGVKRDVLSVEIAETLGLS